MQNLRKMDGYFKPFERGGNLLKPCKLCVHKLICKFIEEYEQYVGKYRLMSRNEFVEVNYPCLHYKRDDMYGKENFNIDGIDEDLMFDIDSIF